MRVELTILKILLEHLLGLLCTLVSTFLCIGLGSFELVLQLNLLLEMDQQKFYQMVNVPMWLIDETDSDYIIQDGPLAGGSFTAVDAPTYDELTGGTDDYAVTHGELELAYDTFDPSGDLVASILLTMPEVPESYEVSFSYDLKTTYNGTLQARNELLEILPD